MNHNLLRTTGLVLLMLTAITAFPTANANVQLAGNSCTTSTSCTFSCNAGPIDVGAFGTATTLVDGGAACGGGAANCVGLGVCAGEGVAFGNDSTGSCVLSSGIKISCSSDGTAALVFLDIVQ